MKTLVVAVRIFCLLPFATGIADLLVGPEVFALSGSTFPETVMDDPALNSQIGFWGAVWFGTGLLLWKCSNDLVRYGDWFQLLCAIVFLSGIGRAIAAARFGLPPTPLTVAMALELIGMPLALLWHRAVLRRLDKADSAERASVSSRAADPNEAMPLHTAWPGRRMTGHTALPVRRRTPSPVPSGFVARRSSPTPRYR